MNNYTVLTFMKWFVACKGFFKTKISLFLTVDPCRNVDISHLRGLEGETQKF